MITIGTKVVVREEADEFMDRSRTGHTGRVVGAVTNDCGASKTDPLWIVEFPACVSHENRRVDWGTLSERPIHKIRDGFWSEELEVVES